MYRTKKKRYGKLPYGGLITLILQILEEFMKEKLDNMENGIERMRKMHTRPTMREWVNVENKVVEIGDRDDKLA